MRGLSKSSNVLDIYNQENSRDTTLTSTSSFDEHGWLWFALSAFTRAQVIDAHFELNSAWNCVLMALMRALGFHACFGLWHALLVLTCSLGFYARFGRQNLQPDYAAAGCAGIASQHLNWQLTVPGVPLQQQPSEPYQGSRAVNESCFSLVYCSYSTALYCRQLALEPFIGQVSWSSIQDSSQKPGQWSIRALFFIFTSLLVSCYIITFSLLSDCYVLLHLLLHQYYILSLWWWTIIRCYYSDNGPIIIIHYFEAYCG